MNKKDLGIYIHIPFCKQKCRYCDFLSFPKYDDNYIECLKKEIVGFEYKEDYEVKTIFFGGGTPSIIKAEFIKEILELIYSNFFVDKNAEITIEANPGTLNRQKLEIYKLAGINRISMGLQSTDNEKLKNLGRIHNFEEFCENYKLARECGFNNINIDLMSALPGQTVEEWKLDLERIVALNPEHISAYSLIIEEGTPFFEMYYNREELLPTEEEEREMYHITRKILNDNGYNQYEISNYSKSGYECRHNISYWKRTDYIGFGLGAASLINNNRFSNTTDMKEYIQSIVNKKAVAKDIEKLTTNMQMEETMFLGLRMIEGVSYKEFTDKFGVDIKEVYSEVIERFEKNGLLEEKNGRVYLTKEGIDVSNYVMSEFLLED